jgi:hypothetical protein
MPNRWRLYGAVNLNSMLGGDGRSFPHVRYAYPVGGRPPQSVWFGAPSGMPVVSDPTARRFRGDYAHFLMCAPSADEVWDQIDREDPDQSSAHAAQREVICMLG